MSTGLVVVLSVLAVGAAVRAAPTYNFMCISNNSAVDTAIGEAQLHMEVTDVAGQVMFRFINDGPEQSTIARVYFDDNGTLDGIASIINGLAVSFIEGASPGVLPAGNNAVPPFVVDFSASATPPPSHNGVDPGEYLAILMDLASGATYADVLSGLDSQDLRVGLHVINFASGGGESFVSIPAPGALVLASLGSVLVGWLRRRQIA